MTLNEIKKAIDEGKAVYWASLNYRIIKDRIGQYLIWSQSNDMYWGLTHSDGITLADQESKFFTA